MPESIAEKQIRNDTSIAPRAFASTPRRNESQEKPESPTPSSSSLPSHTESLRSPLSHRFTHLMDTLQSTLANQTQHLNTLTGYTPIESLKSSIAAQESHLQDTRSALIAARSAYSQAIKQRSASQREVNELLQRKHMWSPTDLERFTALYRSDHANELHETQTHDALIKAEKEAEEAGQLLSESILKRYHEEQIWSDKIRRMSTWGTWGLMGVNVLLFLIFQIGVEPWRRGRLVRGFEEKVKEALEREVKVNINLDTTRMEGLRATDSGTELDKPARNTEEIMEGATDEAARGKVEMEKIIDEEVEKEVTETIELERSIDQATDEGIRREKGRTQVLTEKVKDLFSARQVVVRQWDLTALALEGAAAGLTVAGVIFMLLRRQ
ncbi:MAG: hypothetical protein Q9197_003731 [Variospora fuerteventurae]